MGWLLPSQLSGVTETLFTIDLNGRGCDFQQAIEVRLKPDGDLAPIVDWASKLVGAVCRIAALLHIGYYAPTNFSAELMRLAIPGETFARAVAIG